MTLLLNRCGDDVKITEEVIKAAEGNEGVMTLLLDRREGVMKTEGDRAADGRR
jgi:hypothetical protein